MSYYQVVLEGKNFLIEVNGENKSSEFHTTRWVKASTPEAAKLAAVELVTNDESLVHITHNSDNSECSPTVYSSKLSTVSWMWYIRRKPGRGYTFHLDKNDRAEQNLQLSLGL
ncbi:MAG: hypothetical protein COA42_10845 [Alteromonadaceae bacterium]|nr:MAG: hypothetical protein COA42_10845 [Alteromonadaceae bacterium]